MDRLLHEIWDDSEGLAGLILAGEKGEAARKLFEEGGKKLVHTFYASSVYVGAGKIFASVVIGSRTKAQNINE